MVPQGCEPTRSVSSSCIGTDIAFIPRKVLQSQAGCRPEVPRAQLGSPPASVAQRPHLQSERIRASGFNSRSHLVHPVAGINSSLRPVGIMRCHWCGWDSQRVDWRDVMPSWGGGPPRIRFIHLGVPKVVRVVVHTNNYIAFLKMCVCA